MVAPHVLNVEPPEESNAIGDPSDATRMEGVVFDGHRGWLHLPQTHSPLLATIVFCQPLGREARNAHRSIWLLANRLASSGFAVLRYDHLGTGESLPLPDEVDAWQQWLRGVEKAVEFAQAATNAGTLVLGGVRMGASLAAIAATRVHADALLLLAPVIKGRPWLRELQFATALLRGHSPGNDAGLGLNADGLWLSPQTLESMAKLDLGELDSTSPSVFIASRGDATSLQERLSDLGAAIDFESFEGYGELFQEAYLNEPPDALFRRIASWLLCLSVNWPPVTMTEPIASARLTVIGGEERAVSFGNGLRGVLCTPVDVVGEKKAVIFVNTGGDSRAGIGGFAVEASRELCNHGIAALRFDFAGLGDSAFSDGWRSHIYETPRDEDFVAAVALLAAEDISCITVAGVCSGGYHALEIACRNERIAAAYAVNAAILVWRAGDSLTQSATMEGSSQPWLRNIGRHLSSRNQWRRIFNGEIRWRSALTNISSGLLRRWIARLDRKQTRTFRASMRQLSMRGGQARVVVGAFDSSLDELETHFDRDGAWFAKLPGMSVGIIDGLDHGLFFRESRRIALEDLLSFVERVSSAPA